MGTCCQGPTPPNKHETQIEQNLSDTVANYSVITVASPNTTEPMKKQSSIAMPYKTRSVESQSQNGAQNGLIQLESESNIGYNAELENKNKLLKQALNQEQSDTKELNEKFKKLQERLDNQALNYSQEIDLIRKQNTALRTELQQTITQQNTEKNNKTEMVRKTQLLDLTNELTALRAQTNAMKVENTQKQKLQKDSQKQYEGRIAALEQKLQSSTIVNEPHFKPSFTKKTEIQNQTVVSAKDAEINAAKETIDALNAQIQKLDCALQEQKSENDALFERSKTMTEQLNMDKESIKSELKLLRDKDEGFLNKIYSQREQYKGELYRLKKQFKQRELTLNLEMEALERKKIRAEDLADLKGKTDSELRDIIERSRFTNRDLTDQLSDHVSSHSKREREFEHQILALNNIIKKMKEQNPNASTRSIKGFGILAATNAVQTLKNERKMATQEKSEKKAEKHKDNIKGAIGALFAAKQNETGQHSITDNTSSLLGMVDAMSKYQKMKKIGLPMASIKNKMKMDGFNASQIAKFAGEPPPKPLNGIDLSKHDLKKYAKMKKIGMPEVSVRNKMRMDGIDTKVIATYFGEKVEEDSSDDSGGKPMEPPCPKPEMKKYAKMKKIGMPEVSVRNKMKMDGIDLYWVRDFFGEAQPIIGGGDSGGKPMEPPCPKPEMKKYSKMKKIGMPEVSVRNKMKMDGIDPYWVRDFFGEAQPIVGGGGAKPMEPPCPKPEMKKYERMKKVGLPVNSVKNKMKQDGIHEYWVRDFFGEPQPMVGGDTEEEMKAPCPKPESFSKYSRMKKIGMPEVSVRNKMKMDGIAAYWIRDFFGEAQPKIAKKKKAKKVKRKVKALHWRKKSECDWTHTIWANIETKIELKTITTEKLITPDLMAFLETAFTSVRPKKQKGKGGGNAKKKDETKEITLIDPKRAFNMIVGLRQFEKLGISDLKIRNYLLKLDSTKLTVEMLENLAKFVPTNEELNELRAFKGDKLKLGRSEKFTDCVTCMVDIKLRIDLWKFKIKFKANVFEVESRIAQIRDTLATLQNSAQIASFLKVCLIIGNFMNEGTNRGGAKGIKLESIDRFSSLKTADNSTTMLMFILDFIYKNHNSHGEMDSFPKELQGIVDSAKKIEAKTIRDGVADMKDSLERIGKRITRTSRNLKEVQAQFYKSAGNVLVVFSKLKHKVTKLHSHVKHRKANNLVITVSPGQCAEDGKDAITKQNTFENSFANAVSDDINAEISEKERQKKRGAKTKKNKAISFVDELLLSDEKCELIPKPKKPRKFIIIDPNYKGKRKIRTRTEHEIGSRDHKKNEGLNDGFSADLWDRGETVYETDTDYNDLLDGDGNQSKAKKRGLRRKKHKMKKVKIRRMKRVRRKETHLPRLESSRVSIKCAKTIQRLREQREIDAGLEELGVKRSHARGKSMARMEAERVTKAAMTEPSEANKAPKDKFESMMTGFHTMAVHKVEALETEFENLKRFAGSVAVYFGEHDDLEWEELFGMFLAFFELIEKSNKRNADLAHKAAKQRKKEERARLKREKLAKKGLRPKRSSAATVKSAEPTNILEEIIHKNAKGTLRPSMAKNDIVGYEKADSNGNGNGNGNGKKKKNGMSLLEQIKAKET